MAARNATITRYAGRLAAALAVALAAAGAAAQSPLRVPLTDPNIEPLPIAIPDFAAPEVRGDRPDAGRYGADMAAVITADLERSGLFRPIDPDAFLTAPPPLDMRPRFANWSVLNAQALVVGETTIESDGKLRARFRLWDVTAERTIAGLSLATAPSNWRRMAHIIADAIYERITGEAGYFDTRIVYISETGPPDQRVKRLSIMDQDGANHRYLTDGGTLVLTPRFSPTQQEITYLAYYNDNPRVYLFNIDTGEQEVLGDFPGMTFAPRFSPDGNQVVMSLARAGNSDIYVMDLRTRETRQLTRNPAIDTAPSYSPDGMRIVFESDRGGSQQLYVMDAAGGRPARISFGAGKYGTPVWSPRGDLIAFTKIQGGQFHIGVMRPDGGGERILTRGFLVEGPTWAPNGRVLMYFKQAPVRANGTGGESRLYSIDLTGFNEREITTPRFASDPAWSPMSSR